MGYNSVIEIMRHGLPCRLRLDDNLAVVSFDMSLNSSVRLKAEPDTLTGVVEFRDRWPVSLCQLNTTQIVLAGDPRLCTLQLHLQVTVIAHVVAFLNLHEPQTLPFLPALPEWMCETPSDIGQREIEFFEQCWQERLRLDEVQPSSASGYIC